MESGLEQTEIVKRLKGGKGLKVTPQRFAIYANLLSRADHPTAEQLLTDLNKDFRYLLRRRFILLCSY